MNVPTTLVEEIKLYLQRQANNGDIEAQTLLFQFQQLPTSPPTTVQPTMTISSSEGIELGC
ncbi:MAG: hypothetical protein AB1589_14290 [Cyanobacteriota bacterium]